MKKDKFNSKLRTYVRENISPTNCYDKKCNQCDKCFITSVYNSFKTALNQNCIQIGSYPRFTAIRPPHDLDILYILGNWDEQKHNPQELLEALLEKIKTEYSNPTNYEVEISLQTHSVTIRFKDKIEEVFSVDIVPAYIFSQNELGQDTYKVPEVLREKHGEKRAEFYKKLTEEHDAMDWIVSDPRGYIEVAKQVNQTNEDFRKTVKFIKAWKNSCKEKYGDFKLKSFHIEQCVTKRFEEEGTLEIFDGIFKFFIEIPQIIESPKIKDRADNDKYIDEYLNKLSDEQRQKIIQARDYFLIELEKFSESDSVEDLLKVHFYKRASDTEEYLFDTGIPVLTDDDLSFNIHGETQERKGGFRKYILDAIGLIAVDRKIKFKISGEKHPNIDLFKWKVKNDDNSKEPRGEITDHQTKNDLEHTQYNGNHYVECFAIIDNTCMAKARQNVRLD